MIIFDKIADCIRLSETILHLKTSFNMIVNYEMNPKHDKEEIIILKYLLKEKCKHLNISYSELMDYINKLN